MPKRFIESFDGIRFTPQKESMQRKILHAELELMLALLFGEPVVISEPMSFDSQQFLDIACRVLDARSRLRFKDSPVWKPFLLAFRPKHYDPANPGRSYCNMLKSLFGQTGSEPGQHRFVLSAWPEVSDNVTLRKEMARSFERGSFDAISREVGREKLASLERLNEYFSALDVASGREITAVPPSPHVQAHSPKVSMPEFGQWLMTTKESRFPKDLQEVAFKLREAVRRLPEGINVFNDRSTIRTRRQEIIGATGEAVYPCLLEFIDSSYNQVVASSVRAQAVVFSTDSRARPLSDVAAAETLSFAALPVEAQGQYWSQPTSLHIAPSLEMVEGLRPRWADIWQVLTDDEWINSVTALQQAFQPPFDYDRAEEARLSHIDLLAQRLLDFQIKQESGVTRLVRDVGIGVAAEAGGQLAGAALGVDVAPGVSGLTTFVVEYTFGTVLQAAGSLFALGSLRKMLKDSVNLGGGNEWKAG
ncbi:MAG: hypothetical protein GXW89_19520 [Phycisphaerae bacterium]|nr:hypothetical protein [Phycisphaerae bacterium]